MRDSPTHDARDRNLASGRDGGLDKTYIVEAGAGTGKTTVLIDRLLSLVTAGAEISRIVAITFTEKAAGELRLKLRTAIEDELRDGDPDKHGLMRDALLSIDRAHVGTIHAFCSGILKERPVEAGVDPNFAVADALKQAVLPDHAWEKWLQAELARELPPAVAEARALGFTLPKIRQLAMRLSSYRDFLEFSPEPAPMGDIETFISDLRSEALEFAEASREHCADPDDSGARAIRAFQEATAAIELFPEGARAAYALGRITPAPGAKQGNKKKNWPHSVLDDLRARAGTLRDRRDELRSIVSHNAAVELLKWLRGYVGFYESEKRRLGLLDFEDLLLRTRDLLRDNLKVRRHFKEAYDRILVDEFQDTDPLQSEIVFYLSERKTGTADAWDKVDIEPGKLFIVGDPKQSIYRFRRADIEMYEEAKGMVRAAGGVLKLSENFRTRAAVVDEVNAVFGPIMAAPEDGRRYQPDYADLTAHRGHDGKGAGIVILPPAEPIEKGAKASEIREREAAAVASFISWARDSGELEVLGKAKKRWRPVELRDIAVLFHATNALDAYEQAFSAYGLDYRIAGGKKFYTRREVRELTTVLSAIEDPHDAVAVVGSLRTPFFGVSDEAILLHKSAGGSLNYMERVDGGDPKVREAFELMKKLHKTRNSRGASALLRELFEYTRALELFLLKPSGEQRHANLQKVAELAASLEESEPISFGEFVRWLRHVSQLAAEESESPLSEEGDDFIRMLTIHKAKGLEFPVTILADLARRKGHTDEVIVDRDSRSLALGIGPSGARLATRDYGELLELEKRRREAELMRLLYVGMTRARDALIIPWFAKGSENAGLGLLEHLTSLKERAGEPVDGLRAAGADGRTRNVVSFDTGTLDLSRKKRGPFRLRVSEAKGIDHEKTSAFEARRAWQARLDGFGAAHDRPPVIRTPSELGAEGPGKHVATGSARDLPAIEAAGPTAQAAGECEDEAPAAAGDQARNREARTSGAEFGTLVHDVMEKLDFAAPSEAGALARALARTSGTSTEVADAAALLVAQSLKSPIMNRARSALHAWREVPFCVTVDRKMLEGKIDLLLEEEDGYVIVDYKTDAIGPSGVSELARRYEDQARAYGFAVARVLRRWGEAARAIGGASATEAPDGSHAMPPGVTPRARPAEVPHRDGPADSDRPAVRSVKEIVLFFMRGPEECRIPISTDPVSIDRELAQLLDSDQENRL